MKGEGRALVVAAACLLAGGCVEVPAPADAGRRVVQADARATDAGDAAGPPMDPELQAHIAQLEKLTEPPRAVWDAVHSPAWDAYAATIERTRPAFAVRVERLAREQQVTSEAIYVGGEHSAAWDAYRDVVEYASRRDVVALLEHPSSVVRGYMVRHIAEHLPEAFAALYPRLRDEAPLATQDGCEGARTTVDAEVVSELCSAPRSRQAALDLLVRAARDPGLLPHTRGWALLCTARALRRDAHDAALELLDAHDAEARASALDALDALGSEADGDRIARAASDPSPRVRATVAWRLPHWPSPAATRALEALARDPDRDVRSRAAESLTARTHGGPTGEPR